VSEPAGTGNLQAIGSGSGSPGYRFRYEWAHKKQILERQDEVWLLRGWKSLKFGADNPESLERKN